MLYRVQGHSMEPFCREGDFAFTLPFLRPKIGDVVVAKYGEKLLLKRVQKINGKKYWLQGDNEKLSTDSRNFGWISKEQVLGKTFVVRKTKALAFDIMNV